MGIVLMTLTMRGSPFAHEETDDESERARTAAQVLNEVMQNPEESVPLDLLSGAHAVAVIPHVVKGAFVVGGSYGKGLIAHRGEDADWSAPSYIDLSGGSVGLQIGASATDYILVFTNPDGLKPLLDGKVTLGADASIAAGPVGRSAKASTDVTLNAAIYSYSRSKGAFAGVALDGAALTIDDDANEKVYGRKVSGEEILLGNAVSVNETVRPFQQSLVEATASR
jgi:lipid-binding SYLF domain-containing protein